MILPKCLLLVVGVIIGVAAVKQRVHSRKRVEDGFTITETWTKNGQYWEYRIKRAQENLWRSTEIQRLAPDGSLDFYGFAARNDGTHFKYPVLNFRRLSQPADGSFGPFAEHITRPQGIRSGSVEGGVSSTGCKKGRRGPNCQLISARTAVQNDDVGLDDFDIGLRRPRTRPSRRI